MFLVHLCSNLDNKETVQVSPQWNFGFVSRSNRCAITDACNTCLPYYSKNTFKLNSDSLWMLMYKECKNINLLLEDVKQLLSLLWRTEHTRFGWGKLVSSLLELFNSSIYNCCELKRFSKVETSFPQPSLLCSVRKWRDISILTSSKMKYRDELGFSISTGQHLRTIIFKTTNLEDRLLCLLQPLWLNGKTNQIMIYFTNIILMWMIYEYRFFFHQN